MDNNNTIRRLKSIIALASLSIIALSVIAIPYILNLRTSQQVPVSPTAPEGASAWETNQSATARCEPGKGAVIEVSFTNNEPTPDPEKKFNQNDNAMLVTATDLQSGNSVDLGEVLPGRTATGVIETTKTRLKKGRVRFDLRWASEERDQDDTDTRFADYASVRCEGEVQISCKQGELATKLGLIKNADQVGKVVPQDGAEYFDPKDSIGEFEVELPAGSKGVEILCYDCDHYDQDGSKGWTISWDGGSTTIKTGNNVWGRQDVNIDGPNVVKFDGGGDSHGGNLCVVTGQVTPTNSPTPTNTPTATPTNTPTPTDTPTPTVTNAPSVTPTNTPTPTPTQPNQCVITLRPKAAPTGSPTPTNTPTATPTNIPTPTNTPTPVPSGQPTPTPTNTPVPTSTPRPTATPTNTPTPSVIPQAGDSLPLFAISGVGLLLLGAAALLLI